MIGTLESVTASAACYLFRSLPACVPDWISISGQLRTPLRIAFALSSHQRDTKMMGLISESKVVCKHLSKKSLGILPRSRYPSHPIPYHLCYPPLTASDQKRSRSFTITTYSENLTSSAPQVPTQKFFCSPSPTLPSENTPGATPSPRRGEALCLVEGFGPRHC